jgi:hypothetical protein
VYDAQWPALDIDTWRLTRMFWKDTGLMIIEVLVENIMLSNRVGLLVR